MRPIRQRWQLMVVVVVVVMMTLLLMMMMTTTMIHLQWHPMMMVVVVVTTLLLMMMMMTTTVMLTTTTTTTTTMRGPNARPGGVYGAFSLRSSHRCCCPQWRLRGVSWPSAQRQPASLPYSQCWAQNARWGLEVMIFVVYFFWRLCFPRSQHQTPCTRQVSIINLRAAGSWGST